MNRWLILVVALLFLNGCGPSAARGVVVKGKITKGGAPLTIPGQQDGSPSTINLLLTSTTLAPDGTSSGGAGVVDAKGEFKIKGAGRGVPPGKYRLLMTGETGPGDDYFGGAYNIPNYLKEFDVPADKVGGEFDVGPIELDSLQAAPATP